MQNQGEGSEATEDVEPGEQRVIFINQAQPHKYCANKIKLVALSACVNYAIIDSSFHMLAWDHLTDHLGHQGKTSDKSPVNVGHQGKTSDKSSVNVGHEGKTNLKFTSKY